jgi:cytoskeletal protein RodZ
MDRSRSKEVAMTTRLLVLNAAALAAILAAGAAFAADTPTPATPMPAETTSPAPATPAPAAMTMTPAPAPAAKTERPARKPIAQQGQDSACSLSLAKTEKALAASKLPAESIATAWEHLNAAKKARTSHQPKACKSESQTAAQILRGKV